MLLQIIQCSNIEGAVDDLRCELLGPCNDARMHWPLEMWRYDLHTSRYIREMLHLAMEAEHAAEAMAIWQHVLQKLCVSQ